MAVFSWTSLTNGQIIAFNPLADQLNFDDPAISAAGIFFDGTDIPPPISTFTYGGKTVSLDTEPFTLTTANVTFQNGSLLIIGDNSTAVSADKGPNTIIGGAGDDFILGAEGDDNLSGGGGNDLFLIAGDNPSYGNDTIDGGSGTDRILYFDNGFGVNVNLATGIATGGDGNPGSTLTLTSIENVTGGRFGDTLTGDAGANVLDGGAGNDTISGGAGNDVLDGGPGIDTAIYAGVRSNFTITKTSTGFTISDSTGAEGSDTLATIERLQFSDRKLALDLDGNAGKVAKILGAVFGPAAVSNKTYVGIGLQYLDSGTSYEALTALAIGAAGALTPLQIVNLLWTNVVGSAPSTQQAQPFVDMLNGGMTAGQLGVLAADTTFNTDRINLVGLTSSGIEYV